MVKILKYDDKLRKATFKYIEREIYDLHETEKLIRFMEYEIINETPEDDGIQSGRNSVREISDVTATKATRLVENKQLNRMRFITRSIRKVYDGLIKEKQELVSLYYWERPGELTWEGVAKESNIGRRTAIRWRDKFIQEVAKEMGEQ